MVQKDKKLGFMNYQGQEVIPLKYDVTGWNSNFSEGLAGVAVAGKWGYIDTKDRTAIPFVYDSGYPFKNGLAIVECDKKSGVINKDNATIIPLEYDGIWFIGDGLFEVQRGNSFGVIDKTNKVVIPISKDGYIVSDGRQIFIDRREEGWKVYIKNGDELIPTTYDMVSHFEDGLAAVEVNHKWGYIDKQGKLIIPAQYDMAWSFVNGLAAVKVNHKWGYIDTKGQFTSWSYQ